MVFWVVIHTGWSRRYFLLSNKLGFEAILKIKNDTELKELFAKQHKALRQHTYAIEPSKLKRGALPLTISQLNEQVQRAQKVMDTFTGAINMIPPEYCEKLDGHGYVCTEDKDGNREVYPRHDSVEGAKKVNEASQITETVLCKTCSTGCSNRRCACYKHGMECSDSCGCSQCTNFSNTPITAIRELFLETDGDMGEGVDDDNMAVEDDAGDDGNELEQYVSLIAEDAGIEDEDDGEVLDEYDDDLTTEDITDILYLGTETPITAPDI